ncbi:MAG TPA: hypothetical protein VGO11_06815, partial [Chthoniobacteraceae bacterium]|nr:hypothetical protein [Chthoniobacteraceae bacterium]
LPSGLPEHVDDTEDLARFLTQSNQFNSTMAKPAAFLPNPKDRETSVSRHGRVPLETLWALGLAAAGSRTLYGAVFIKAGSVRRARLQVVSSEPPDRHAVIIGWPWQDDDPELRKAAQKELAILLASAAGEPLLK